MMNHETLTVAVARGLKMARELKGLTPESAAAQSNGKISNLTIREVERGNRTLTLPKFFILCEVYNTTPSRLLTSIESDLFKKKAS